MEEIILDLEDFLDDEAGGAVISAPTGIIFTAQVGGIACRHPKCEGFMIPIRIRWDDENDFLKALKDFDDCKWGCSGPLKDENKNNEYAQAVDEFLIKHLNGKNIARIDCKFDYERIGELMEGWWPVIINFIHEREFRGYLYFGSCD